MPYISSDTNVWIDFSVIGRLELPFRLPYTYIMSRDALEDEILSPPGLGKELISHGLLPVEISVEEFYLADQYGMTYPRLSTYDRIALAVAKERQITLLTGDGVLRKAAKQEDVPVFGTLGILDRLLGNGYISKREMKYCLERLKSNNGKRIRLPEAEIERRLRKMDEEYTGETMRLWKSSVRTETEKSSRISRKKAPPVMRILKGGTMVERFTDVGDYKPRLLHRIRNSIKSHRIL